MPYSNILIFFNFTLHVYPLCTFTSSSSFSSPPLPRFLTLFLKVVQKLHKEHISSSSPSPDFQTLSELLQWSLDMCKTRINVMTQDSRKAFMSILTSLIEKSPDTKLLRILTKIVEEWVKAKVGGWVNQDA